MTSSRISPEMRMSGNESAHTVARFLLYATLGASVGLVVAALEWVTIEQVLHRVADGALYVQAGAPVLGLVLTAAILRVGWRTKPTTSDVYVQAYHGDVEIEPRRVFPKLAAAVATVGLGGPVGLEGPSIFAGSAMGHWLGRRRLTMLGPRNRRLLLAAGAAAGVAAIFQAPATGVLFALEAPFRRDIARHALVPALVASAASYITFVLIIGPRRLLNISPTEVPLTQEVLGAIVLGIVGGLAARYIAKLFHGAKDWSTEAPLRVRLPAAGLALAGAAIAANALVDLPVTLGPGAEIVTQVVLDPTISVWVIIALFVLRAVSTSAILGAGGVGGVFIPLVVQGLLLGRVVQVLFDGPAPGLFPVVGLAAVLGAGYRTPMAAVMFVAETTGRSEFVIPALIATAISQTFMGSVSVSSGQVDERTGMLERRLALPVSAVTIPLWSQVDPGELLLDVVDRLGDSSSTPVVPVYDTEYRGLLVLADIASNLMEHGIEISVESAMRRIPGLNANSPALEAARMMNEHNTAAIAVVDDNGIPIGVVTAISLAGLDDLD